MTISFLTDPPQIGHNNPPKTPYEQSKERIEELYAEAKNWLDGEAISTQEQADEIQRLLREIQKAEKEADERRKVEVKPFDDGKAEVQARYNPLIQKDRGLSQVAVGACKSALAHWLRKLEEEQRKAAEEARKKAEELQRQAQEAIRKRDAANLAEREAAEALLADAAIAEAQAKKAEKARPVAKGEGRAAGLRTYYRPEITDYRAFASYVWTNHMGDLSPMLDELAKRYVDAGKRALPGVVIHEDKRVA
jgi:DNA repair exonuclease SbcCD ATPase subunit